MLPKADYKTFPELAEYAQKRAVISAKRGGHQEWAYWIKIARWAAMLETSDPKVIWRMEKATLDLALEKGCRFRELTAAEAYAHMVHCCKMLRNDGRLVPTMSLKWLRQAAGVEDHA